MLSSRLNKIVRYPEKIPADKRLHALLGLFLIANMNLYDFELLTKLITLVVFAYAIEFFQKKTKSGAFEHWDAIAVVIGGLLGMTSELKGLL